VRPGTGGPRSVARDYGVRRHHDKRGAATVKDGFVTLSGGVDWQYQRHEANFVASNVPGVTGVNDHSLNVIY